MIVAAYLLFSVAAIVLVNVFGYEPIGYGLTAPAGVYLVGVVLTIRCVLHDRYGSRVTLLAIAAASLLTTVLALRYTVAVGLSFLLGQIVAFVIYQRLRKRGFTVAALSANVTAVVVDTLLFLWLAFGDLRLWLVYLVARLAATCLTIAAYDALLDIEA